MTRKSFQELNRTLLYNVDKCIRYQHHIVFLSTYLKFKRLPKGFKLRFHNNIKDLSYNNILKNCSFKLMERTVAHYRRYVKHLIKLIKNISNTMSSNFPDRSVYVKSVFTRKQNRLNPILDKRRLSKFQRDHLDLASAKRFASTIMKSVTIEVIDSTPPIIQSKAQNNDQHHPIILNSGQSIITSDLKSLCAKGPSFVPTPLNFDWLQMQKDFDAFSNKMRARYIFSNVPKKVPDNDTVITVPPPPRKKSKWKANKTNCPELETFLSNVERELFSNTNRQNVPDNLTRGERESLKQWRRDELFNESSNLVMRLQDKGNRFVIVDKYTDVIKANEQIAKSSFARLEIDPTQNHIEKVIEWANKWYSKCEISKEWKEFVINVDAQPAKNSTLYKTHKDGTPVRLLTSGCNTAIENLARFIEVVCAPLAEKIPTLIKNTDHLLNIIDSINNQGVPDEAILVSFDIVNMYPSIDNQFGLKAVQKALNGRELQKPPTDCIIEGLKLCLYNNNSVFANENLLQTNGTATGAPNSCSYADIAISTIDEEVLKIISSKYTEMMYFGRYRDDCLSLWIGSIDALNDFHDFLNSLNSNLKFTMEVGNETLCFLDLKISIRNNKLETSVYSKPTDSHLYLHAKSCHQKASINGIQKGVAIRLRKICSTDAEYQEKSAEYTSYLTARGHDQQSVKSTFNKLSTIPRNDARKSAGKKNPKDLIVFSTSYNPRGPNVNNIVRKYLHLIQNNPKLNTLIPKGTILVANKREKNLKELLLRADPYNIKSDLCNNNPSGYEKCGKKCDSCINFVDETSDIISNATGRKFKIHRNSTCSTENVIYVAYCVTCGKQGVGSTVAWKPRLANYKSHIKKNKPTCRIAKHFIDECKNESLTNLRFVIVDTVNNVENLSQAQIDHLLLEKEKFWIGTLITQHHGLNGTHDWNRNKRSDREKDL